MHTFKNFKNFAEAQIDLSKPMTLLIGRNGSGKSNVIEGVELLAELVKQRKVHEISDIGRGGRFEVRGSLAGCFKQGTDFFELGCKDITTYGSNAKYSVKFNLKPTIHLESGVSIYGDGNDDGDIDEYLNELYNLFDEQGVSAFDIYPRIMRQYSPIGLTQLSRNGENISSILYYLKQNSPEILEKILQRIQQLPEEAFESFEFITTSDNSDILFALKYPNGEIISAKLLSDGTLRALAILTALETVPEYSRIIIEEIDNGVHASRVNVLIDAIWEASNRRHLNTLITTHNPATLDSLNDEQLECVVVCHYDKESQSAKLTPFFELPNIDVLLQKGKLGGLVTRNAIEHYLDPEFEKQQAKIAKEWLESCQ
jgi:predicted ATPase